MISDSIFKLFIETIMNFPKTFKVVLIGSGGSGKTTLLNRLLTGEFNKQHLPTLGVEVHPLPFQTNYGPITLNIWDTAGMEQYGGLRDGYFIKADGAISFADSTSPNSFKISEGIEQTYSNVCPYSPVIRVVNKVDIKGGIIPRGYIPISARSNYNFDLPFLQLIRTLTNLKDLVFQESPAIEPPEVQLKDIGFYESFDSGCNEFEEDIENIENIENIEEGCEDLEGSTKQAYTLNSQQVPLTQVVTDPFDSIQSAKSMNRMLQLSKL